MDRLLVQCTWLFWNEEEGAGGHPDKLLGHSEAGRGCGVLSFKIQGPSLIVFKGLCVYLCPAGLCAAVAFFIGAGVGGGCSVDFLPDHSQGYLY